MILLILQDHSRSPFYLDLTEWREVDSPDADDVDILYVDDYWYHLDIVELCAERQIPVIKIDELSGWEPVCKATRALQILQLIAYNAAITKPKG